MGNRSIRGSTEGITLNRQTIKLSSSFIQSTYTEAKLNSSSSKHFCISCLLFIFLCLYLLLDFQQFCLDIFIFWCYLLIFLKLCIDSCVESRLRRGKWGAGSKVVVETAVVTVSGKGGGRSWVCPEGVPVGCDCPVCM